MKRYVLASAAVLATGFIGGLLGWTTGVAMDRYRWLGLGPEEFWQTDPENVWAWGFLIGGAIGMALATAVIAWRFHRPGPSDTSARLPRCS